MFAQQRKHRLCPCFLLEWRGGNLRERDQLAHEAVVIFFEKGGRGFELRAVDDAPDAGVGGLGRRATPRPASRKRTILIRTSLLPRSAVSAATGFGPTDRPTSFDNPGEDSRNVTPSFHEPSCSGRCSTCRTRRGARRCSCRSDGRISPRPWVPPSRSSLRPGPANASS